MYGIGIVQVRSDSYERIHRASLSLSLSLFLHHRHLSLFAATTSEPGRTGGTDSHTSRVSIKRRRKWRAFLDRCGLHGSAKRAALGKQGEKERKEEHAPFVKRPRSVSQVIGKCHRIPRLSPFFLFSFFFFFFFTFVAWIIVEPSPFVSLDFGV